MEQIEKGHRIPNNNPNKVPSIVVQFKCREDRDMWVKKKKKVVTNDNCFGNGNGQKIYVNEHMTPFYKQLLWKTKNFARQNNVKYTWFRDGKIRIRIKEDDKFSKIIRSEKDLVLNAKP